MYGPVVCFVVYGDGIWVVLSPPLVPHTDRIHFQIVAEVD